MITWLGHASFRLTDGKTTVIIDPWEVSHDIKADILLL